MPESNDALTRQKAIDRCLSSGRGYTMKQLMKECNNDLLYEGKKPVTSMNTIRADVRRVLSPDSFRDKMKQRVEKMLLNYN